MILLVDSGGRDLRRFGFVNAEKFGITTEWGANYLAFMGMELQKGYLDGVTGKFIETIIYNEDFTKEFARSLIKNIASSYSIRRYEGDII